MTRSHMQNGAFMNAVRAVTVLRSRMGLCVASVFGCLAVARRGLLIAVPAVAVALSVGSVAEAQSASGLSRRSLSSQSKPVKAVSPPARVGVALAKTQQARYVTLTEATQGGTLRYEVDNRHVKAESWTGRKVSLIQIGAEVYAPAAKGGCYESAKRPSALLPNVAGTLLPSGIAALHYTVKGKTIHWTIKSASKYQPHGSVTVNAAGRIVAATVYSGPGVPLTAVVSYPAKAPKIKAPGKLCST
jgi:hypothetical protein